MCSFHSTTVVFSVYFLKYEHTVFYSGHFFIVGIAILSRINVDCVFLASTLNSILVLLEVLSQYLATVIITGVCRTLSNMMELFVKTRNDIFSSIIPFWQGSENASGHDTVTFSNLISFQNLLRIAIKRKRWVMTSHLANSFKKSKKRYINGCCTEHATTQGFQVGKNCERCQLKKLWVNPGWIALLI